VSDSVAADRSGSPDPEGGTASGTDSERPPANRWERRAAEHRPYLAPGDALDRGGQWPPRAHDVADRAPRPMSPAKRRAARAARKRKGGRR
jgi:hypothetical protein